MAIQHRRGNYADFDPTKMVAGEPAVVLGGDPTSSDGKAAYIAFGPGSVKKLATAEDMRDEIYNQTQNIIQDIEEGVADDVEQAESAAQRAETAAAQFEIDATLTQQGKPADAKKVGDEISDIKADLSELITSGTDKTEVDKSTFVKMSGYYISGGTSDHVIGMSSGVTMFYVPCLPSTTYEITKVKSARFRLAYTNTTPADLVPAYNYTEADNETSVTFTSGNDAVYLCVYYAHNSDTISESDIYNSVKVYKLSTEEKKINTVLFNTEQIKTEEEKRTAQKNIGVYDTLKELEEAVETIEPLSEIVKAALLNCFAHVAWIDEHGQTYYDALEAALNDIQSISTVYTQSGTVYATDTLDSLKENLVVIATKLDSTQYVVPDSKYTLSGMLMAGVSTITVTYKGQTATFNVNVTDSRLVYEIPANTNFTDVSFDSGIPVFGQNDSFTFLIDVNSDILSSNAFVANHGGLYNGTLRLNVDISNNVMHFVTNVMYSDYYADYYTPGDISALTTHNIKWVVRMNNKNVRKALFVDGVKLVDKTENVSSYMSDKLFTQNYFIGAQNANGVNRFYGTANLFRIYNSALDISEINAILGIELE